MALIQKLNTFIEKIILQFYLQGFNLKIHWGFQSLTKVFHFNLVGKISSHGTLYFKQHIFKRNKTCLVVATLVIQI